MTATAPPMTVRFLQPAQRLSMNHRVHWRTRHRLTKLWRHAAHRVGDGELDTDHRRRRDPHNQAPTVKAIIDGLVDASVWPDDTNDFVVVLDPRFYKPSCPLAMATVNVHLIPRAGELPT